MSMLVLKLFSTFHFAKNVKFNWLRGFCSQVDKNIPHDKDKKENIPIDVASLYKIRSKEMIYVDKTEIIYNQILSGGTYFSIFRPRRFGKSLLCSTLANMFGGEDAESLFEGLWIKDAGPKVWDFKKAKHPVIHLDMINAAGPDSNSEIFTLKVKNMLKLAAEELNIDITTINLEYPPQSIFSNLIYCAKEKFGKNVVVIIDNYDKPVLDLLHKPNVAQDVYDDIQDFSSILKSRDSELRLVFITGMLQFSSMSMFSTLNNILDLTFNYDCGSLLGYTEEEISHYFPNSLKSMEVKLNKDRACLMNDLKQRYGGYMFGINKNHGKLSSPVFNPSAINRVLDNLQLNDDAWFHPGSTIKFTEDLSNNLIRLTRSFDFSNLYSDCSPKAVSIEAFAFYDGYLTIKEYKNRFITLGVPNLNNAKVLFQNIFSSLFEKVKEDQKFAYQMKSKELLDLMSSCDFSSVEELEKIMSDLISFYPYNQLDIEESYRFIIDAALDSFSIFFPLESSTSKRRADTVLCVPDQNEPKRILVIQYKLGTKDNNSSKENAKLALDQIDQKKYFEKFSIHKADIYCIGVGIFRRENHDSFTLSIEVDKVK